MLKAIKLNKIIFDSHYLIRVLSADMLRLHGISSPPEGCGAFEIERLDEE